MRYIIADIHGCYNEYIELLEKIEFADDDELYVLGDAMDRGPEPMKVIQDIMNRPNVFYILGNHDYMLLELLPRLMEEITESNVADFSAIEDMLTYYYDWIRNGGAVTIEQFRTLKREEQLDIIDYVRDASTYKILEQNDRLYVLVHAGIKEFDLDKELEEYEPYHFVSGRTDYTRQYFPGDRIRLVTGHTPTIYIREDQKPLVYQENGHIALDCGCVFGGTLAAYCIETGETTYVTSKRGELL